MADHPSPDPVILLNHAAPTRSGNQARVAPTSGRWFPKKYYKSPEDIEHLMNPAEFAKNYIEKKPGNLYTKDISTSNGNTPHDSLSPVTSRKTFAIPSNSCAATRKDKKRGFWKWRLC